MKAIMHAGGCVTDLCFHLFLIKAMIETDFKIRNEFEILKYVLRFAVYFNILRWK